MPELVRFGSSTESNKAVMLDIEALISTRLLLQANSGGGKSYALRKMIEEAFGKVQIILLDIEGEFATLREKYDFFLIGSTQHGADLPISLKVAGVLPKRLLELQASTIIDMSELKAHERILFVKRFLESLVNLPKELWNPVIVVLDEAHVFCPQKESCESANAVIDLASRGRKRGQCLWAATQRISKLNKDVAAECNNKLIGRASLDVDMKRASEEIGFTTKEDMRSLRELNAGEFFAFGPALAKGVNKISIDAVKTSHPKVGHRIIQSSTPTPQRVMQLIGKLADLSVEADSKEKTEADMKRDIASLRGQLLAAENKIKKLETSGGKERVVERQVAVLSPEVKKELEKILTCIAKIEGTVATVTNVQNTTRFSNVITPSLSVLGGPLRSGAMRILATITSFHPKPLTKSQVAVLVGMKASGGTFNTYIGELKRNVWIQQLGDYFYVTPDGMQAAGDVQPVSRKPEDILRLWAGQFRSGAGNMLREIAGLYPEWISKGALGDRLGMVASGGTFNTYLGELRSTGLVELRDGLVRATKELFPE